MRRHEERSDELLLLLLGMEDYGSNNEAERRSDSLNVGVDFFATRF